jgi:hypothetical protein
VLRLGRRHPTVVVLLTCFLAVASVLLVKNRGLFDAPIREDGDFAANSIIIDDAKHFDLLVGNYSRQLFSHPGPAAFYLQGAGEAVFYDALDVAPAPFNGQALAVLLQNSLLVALVIALVYRAARSWLAVITALTVVIAFASSYGDVLSSTWMPYYYFPPFLLLLVATASLAAGEGYALPCVVLAGGLLVHGHVEFAFFVPVIALVGAVAFARHHGGVRAALRAQPSASWSALAVLALFLLPIGLNLILHWPGEIDDYIKYSTSDRSGGHSIREGLEYVLRFWSRDSSAGLIPAATIVISSTALAVALPPSALRRLLLRCLFMGGVATLLLWFYAVRGIDDLSEDYIGYFYWAVPLVTMLVAVVAAVHLLHSNRRAVAAAVGLCIIVTLMAGRGSGLVNAYHGSPELPGVVAGLAAERSSPDQPLVITLEHATWPDMVGVLVEADREGVPACVDQPFWEFMVTPDFICTPHEAATGMRLHFDLPGSTGGTVVATMERSIVTTAPPGS